MQYTLQTIKITLTPADQALLDKKLNRLAKFLATPYTLAVKFSHDAHHRQGLVINCALNIILKRRVVHVTRTASSVQDALDAAIAAARPSLRREKSKPIS